MSDSAAAVDDLMGDRSFTLQGKAQHIRPDPAVPPFAIWRIRPAGV